MRKIVFLLLLFYSVSLFGSELGITATPRHMIYNALYPVNFNPDHPEDQPLLFTVELTGTLNWDEWQLRCDMTYRDYSAYSILKPKANYIIGSKPLTNRDIIRSNDNVDFTVDQNFDDFLDDIDDLILETGRMPDGNYIFNFQIQAFNRQGQSISENAVVTITIRSPISISLITPGNSFGSGAETISDPYPNFVWFSNLAEYSLRLYELDAEYGSAEDIEQQLEPYFETTDIATTFFPYPSFAPELKDGYIYAWQVISSTSSPLAAQEEIYKSGMYLFRYSQTGEVTTDEQMLINLLSQLNIETIDELIGLIESGYFFESSTLDGKTITIEELQEVLAKIASGEIKINKLTVE